MKKFLSLLLTAILAVMLCSCTSSRQQLEDGLKSANRECPLTVGAGVTMTGIFLENDYVVFSYLCDESSISAQDLYNGIDGETFIQMAAMEKGMNKVLNLMVDSNTGVKFRVTGTASGFCEDITFDSQEVKAWQQRLKNGEVDGSPAGYLTASMNAAKKGCPMQVDEITIMTDCGYENNTVFYTYTILESDELTIDDIDEEAMEEMLYGNLTNGQIPAAAQLVGYVKDVNGKFRYTYVGNQTGRTMVIVIDSDEL